MADYRQGYKYKLYYGVAGSTAATQITNATDVDYATDPELAETTVRGDGSAVPIVYEVVTAIKPTITWTMTNKVSDTTLTALIAANRTGAIVAIRCIRQSSNLGFDGDCNIGMKESAPLKGIITYEFTATASDELRAAALNS